VFERYTDAARRMLFFARYEADQSGSVSVESVHLLLGLIREAEGNAALLLRRAPVQLEALRMDAENGARTEEQSEPDENRLSSTVRRILRCATEEADRLLDAGIDTEHVLLGILRDGKSAAASILAARGVRLDAIRGDVVHLRSKQRPPESPSPRPVDTRRHVAGTRRHVGAPGVHIAPTAREPGGGAETGSDGYWALEGFDLKTALSRVFSTGEETFPWSRIELAVSVDAETRFDFFLVPAAHESHADRNRLMREGIERHFHVTIALESRPMDVYILTAPDGQRPGIRNSSSGDFAGGGISFAHMGFDLADVGDEPPTPASFQARFPTPHSLRSALARGSIGSISISNGTMGQFCQTLEEGLDRPVVDETGLVGRYDLELLTAAASTSEFLQELRRQLGFELTRGRRSVTLLVVRPN
jgi:uncharacterized protein (TIGR03435 family)